jgi:hypothetical protein
MPAATSNSRYSRESQGDVLGLPMPLGLGGASFTHKPDTRIPAAGAWLMGVTALLLLFCAFASGNNKSKPSTPNNVPPTWNNVPYGQVPATYVSEPSATWPATQQAVPGFGTNYFSKYYDYNYRPPVGQHYVAGHYRNGTYVSGHYRTNPDDSFWNNWSSRGNVNPHTGRVGTRQPGGTRRR